MGRRTRLLLGLCSLAVVGCESSEESIDFELATASTSQSLMPANGMPMNGMPMNGLPMNGLPMNGMPTNGLPMNGLPMNGLPMNGLAAPSFTTTEFGNWFHWFSGCTTLDGCDPSNPLAGATGVGTPQSRTAASLVMKYIVRCACPASTTLTYTDRTGSAYSWTGMVGLAPNWCSSTPTAASVADQEWVSACLLGMVNTRAGNLPPGLSTIQISMTTASTEQPQLYLPHAGNNNSSAEYIFYYGNQSFVSAVYGNIFGDPAVGQKGQYAASGSAAGAWRIHTLFPEIGRDCFTTGCGILAQTGCSEPDCYDTGTYFPDGHTNHPMPTFAQVCTESSPKQWYRPASCRDPQGRTWTRILGVADPTPGYMPYGNFTSVAGNFTDANGVSNIWTQQQLTKSGQWAGMALNYVSSTVPMTYSIKYRSTAPAKIRIITHVSRGNTYTSVGTGTLPSTGGKWAWGNITGTKPANDQTVYGVMYLDSTSKNATIDGLMLSL